jgi:hypothetical protein
MLYEEGSGEREAGSEKRGNAFGVLPAPPLFHFAMHEMN